MYYSAWVQGIFQDISEYNSIMQNRWDTYSQLSGTVFDQSIEDLTFTIGTPNTLPPPPSEFSNIVYARSGLLNYMLDLELTKSGFSLDDLMRYLYENFAIAGKKYKQEDISLALEALVGNPFNAFFDTYLYTNAPLPLDGNFQYLAR